MPKPILLLALFAGIAPGCTCGPATPTPVTLRIANRQDAPIFVDASDERLGLQLRRRVGGAWLPFVETPRCECLACDLVCGGCNCPEPQREPRVMKVGARGSAERIWPGEIQMAGIGACSGQTPNPACLEPDNPPLDEALQVELCYATSSPGAEGADAGAIVPGVLPEGSVRCVLKEFRVADGEVEISPESGAACASHADCQGAEELCFNGACTTTCPVNDFPAVGGAWQIRIPEPVDREFFTVLSTDGRVVYDGEGTVGSVRYDNNTMTLQLARRQSPDAGPTVTASVFVTLPPGVSVPISAGEGVHVTLVDASATNNPENRALVIRSGEGELLLAADTAQRGPILSAAQTAPFAVSRGDQIVGCAHDDCGKNLFRTTRFAAADAEVELSPGGVAQLPAAQRVWSVVNVGNSSLETTWCWLDELMPYAVADRRQ